MLQCEGSLLGRQPLAGALDAATLAALVRSLLPTTPGNRRQTSGYILRCQDDALQFCPLSASALLQAPQQLLPSSTRRRHDDEGFESDDDSRSMTSDDTVSNSSSCCFVDDHVYRRGAVPRPILPAGSTLALTPVVGAGRGGALPSTSSTTSSVATDSANSSGASDTDDVDTSTTSPTSVASLVKSLSLYQRTLPNPSKDGAAFETPTETFSVNDVAFCHTDPAFPKVVVWVVKRRRNQTVSGDASSGGLEALVFECVNDRALRKLCEHFQEAIRRFKLEQYRHPHRRKDFSPNSTVPLPKSQLYVSNNQTINRDASPKLYGGSTATISKSQSKTSGNEVRPFTRVKTDPHPLGISTKFNLVHRTDGDGVTHIEVSRQEDNNTKKTNSQELGGPSSIISISTPDDGNLLAPGRSFTKEIDGVIRSDVDSGIATRRLKTPQPAILVVSRGDSDADELRKVWTPSPSEANAETEEPPQRPERRRYLRRNKPPAPQPPQDRREASPVTCPQQKVVRGQYIRVAVDQQPWMYSTGYGTHSWGRSSSNCREVTLRRPFHDEGTRRPRVSRSKSPPARRRPMAYRYVDAVVPPHSNSLSSRFLGGISQRLRDAVGGGGGSGAVSVYGTTGRRKSTPDMFRSADNLLVAGGSNGCSNLKSVIKKGRRNGEPSEPKKVTFSAYATVQVVD